MNDNQVLARRFVVLIALAAEDPDAVAAGATHLLFYGSIDRQSIDRVADLAAAASVN